MQTFDPTQITNWRKFEEVRRQGHYNMFACQAQAATGLSQAEYYFVLKNFAALKEAAKETLCGMH